MDELCGRIVAILRFLCSVSILSRVNDGKPPGLSFRQPRNRYTVPPREDMLRQWLVGK
jgi:hypothetical protein